jgi:hypothetical protein
VQSAPADRERQPWAREHKPDKVLKALGAL